MSLQLAKPEHEVVYQELVDLVKRHAGKLSAIEMLAVAANMLGKMIAMQDQRSVTPATAMKIVADNIEHGNKMVLDKLSKSDGRA